MVQIKTEIFFAIFVESVKDFTLRRRDGFCPKECYHKIFGKCFNLLVKVGIMNLIYYQDARW